MAQTSDNSLFAYRPRITKVDQINEYFEIASLKSPCSRKLQVYHNGFNRANI